MRLNVGNSEKIMIFIKIILSSFLQFLMFLDMKLQDKIKFWAKSKRKFKNSSIRTRTGRPKFDYFSSNFSKNLSISMRYTTLPLVGVFHVVPRNKGASFRSIKSLKLNIFYIIYNTYKIRYIHSLDGSWPALRIWPKPSCIQVLVFYASLNRS